MPATLRPRSAGVIGSRTELVIDGRGGEALSAERARFAREMRDVLAHSLSARARRPRYHGCGI
jgi:hypothetical protein